MTNFIFMFTHNDVMVLNALEVFEEIKNTQVMHACIALRKY